jgi:hypothetical protein
MEVSAISKGTKEQILVDGEVFLKSVAVGRWNYIVRISYTDTNGNHKEFDGKSATKENAEKWQPWELGENYLEVPEHLKGKGSWRAATRTRRRRYFVPYTNIKREVVEVSREG